MSAAALLPAVALAGLVLIAVTAGDARADDFLKSSPGELAASHASIDRQDQCASCHEPDNSVSARKCLGCHEHQDLQRRIDRNEGFHASPKVTGQPCKMCHQEHRGRRFDLMGWRAIGGPQAFDHKLAGWQLDGKHARVGCADCHRTTDQQGLRTYLAADRACASCHAKDQPHGAVRAVNLRCERCHGEAQWTTRKSTLAFDHGDKDQAAMPLLGTHADVACAKCHPRSAFKLAQFDGSCARCHQSPHSGQLFGAKPCQSCHSPALRAMTEVQFDHKKQTGYPLVAKHAQVACAACHTRALGTRKPAAACESCHAKDSRHAGRFDKISTACATCHSQRGWKAGFQFNHQAETGFDLTGKHARAACRDCHRGKSPSEFERFDRAGGCMGCHKHQKAHGGKFKPDQCLTCHAEAGNRRMRTDTTAGSARETFHGERSRFPLHGGHASVQCQQCHANDVYQDTPAECGACHEDSLHHGSLGAACARCHEPGLWTAARFDHRRDTRWPLEGKHQTAASCEGCHPARRFKGTPTGCAAAGCHQADDVHRGALGTQCQTCHSTDGALVFRHNRDAKFAIDGKHAPLTCAKCHPSIAFKPVARDCAGCHAEPAIHKGRYGTDCARCHSTRSFGDIRALHDVGEFSLSGAHDQVACATCHPGGDRLRGAGNLCITCHKRDDIHGNALSPRCGECHTQRAFAPARFDHISVGCNLMGLHATLPCADCHRAGNYGAVSPMCVSCHRGDALRVTQPDHRALIDCGGCHNPSAWIPSTPLGGQSICR